MKRQHIFPGPIIAYKGFGPDLKCRDHQYEIGKSYKHDGPVERCSSGFHSCEYPLDVLGYYAPADAGKLNRYALVDVTGKISRDESDSKIASAEIHIRAELKIPDLVAAAVKFIMAGLVKTETNTGNQSAATNTGNQSAATNTGDQSAATNTGNQSAATNTGNQSAATNTGDQSAATNAGDWSAATNAGDRSAATNTGDWSAATNTGDWSAATNTGYRSAATNTGYRSAATNTGDWSAATNTGDWSAATNTGYRSAATNTGDRSAATNTGDWSAATNTGYRSAATNTGDRSAASIEGEAGANKNAVAMASGYESKAKASAGSAIVCVYRDEDYNLVHIKAGIAGKDVKADTWYTLNAKGKFVEVMG
jgi:hypothetical protein